MTHQTKPEPLIDREAAWPSLWRPSETFGYRIYHVAHAWQRKAEAVLAPFDLTHMQFVVLAKAAWMTHSGEIPSQNRIAQQGNMDRMMVSKVVRTLETKGFLARATYPDDPRANRVDPTPEGTALLARAIPKMIAAQTEFFGRLGEDGQAALAEQLDQLLRLEGIPR